MTVDRDALRRLLYRSDEEGRVQSLDAIPDILDELDAKDRRIAELETMVQRRDAQGQLAGDRITGLELRLSIATELNVNDRKQITDLESQLAASRDIIRHFEQERDSWPAAYRERAKRTDAEIAALRAGLSEAVQLIEGTTQCESQHPDFHDDPDWITAQRLRGLLPSEET